MQVIFVGDVQGCADEFDELIARARATFGDAFELWLVGDLVNRGPYNLRVLEQVRELVDAGRARCVLGNHDLALLRVASGLRELRPGDTFQEVLESPHAEEWLEWLRRQPVVETGVLGDRRFALVHAAVHPDWSLEDVAERGRRVHEQLAARKRAAAEALLAANPRRDTDRAFLDLVTRCRSVRANGRWSSEEPVKPADAWHARWRSRGHDYGVVYGHWATQGLHVEAGLRGLDTGCIHHGYAGPGFLTAWLPDPGSRDPFGVPDERFWQVPARKQYPWARSSPRASARNTIGR